VLTFVTDESVERRENWQSGRHPTSAPHLPR